MPTVVEHVFIFTGNLWLMDALVFIKKIVEKITDLFAMRLEFLSNFNCNRSYLLMALKDKVDGIWTVSKSSLNE